MLIYLVYFRPLESKFLNIMEAFNEVTCILLMYHLQLFTDFVPLAETRSDLGISFITFISLNVAVHVFFLLRQNYHDIKRKIQIKLHKKK